MSAPIDRPGPGLLGRPSRKGAAAAVAAHVAVLKGGGLKGALSDALHEAKNLGGQERRFVAFATRELSRHMRLLDQTAKALGHPPSSFSLVQDQAIVRYALWRRWVCGEQPGRIEVELALPGPVRPRSVPDRLLSSLLAAPAPALELEDPAARYSFTTWLAGALQASVPSEEGQALLAALNREATLVLRVRPPGSRAARLAELLEAGFPVRPASQGDDALVLEEHGTRIFDSALVKRGQIQVMDLGSQLIVELCQPDGGFDGARVVDYCAGAGGKALALADRVGEGGRVWAHDLSQRRLDQARQRARQFGLRQVSFPKVPPLTDAQVVLIDAPCSGAGTLAREPDQKWKVTAASVAKFQKTQGDLLDEVAAGVRAGTIVVYATCSLLRAEGEDVIEAFLQRHPAFERESAEGWVPPAVCAGPYLRTYPHRSDGGGFFGARLRKRLG